MSDPPDILAEASVLVGLLSRLDLSRLGQQDSAQVIQAARAMAEAITYHARTGAPPDAAQAERILRMRVEKARADRASRPGPRTITLTKRGGESLDELILVCDEMAALFDRHDLNKSASAARDVSGLLYKIGQGDWTIDADEEPR